MAAPMQHVGKNVCKSLAYSCRHTSACNSRIRLWSIYLLSKYSSNANEKQPRDYYGISEESNSEKIQTSRGRLTDEELYKKYSYKQEYNDQRQYNLASVSFGSLRVEPSTRERRNRRSKRNQTTSDEIHRFGEKRQQNNVHSVQSYITENDVTPEQENIFDEQYFSYESKNNFDKPVEIDVQNKIDYGSGNFTVDKSSGSMNYVDSQYFYTLEEKETSHDFPNLNSEEKFLERHNPEFKRHLFTKDIRRFEDSSPKGQGQLKGKTYLSSDIEKEEMNYVDKQYFATGIHTNHEQIDNFKQRIVERKNTEKTSRNENKKEGRINVKKSDHFVKSKDDDKSTSAFDVALKIRKKLKGSSNEEKDTAREKDKTGPLFSGPVDSKGFRILKNQVPDVMNTPSAMVVKLLKDSILYDKDNIIAIEKPYGLPSHGGPGVHMSVAQLLPDLARLVDPSGQLDTFHMVHRLDRQTTGVMLLAKTAETAWQLHRVFRRREVIKKYWVLTKGVPIPEEGVIDIPMAEGTVDRYHRMVLKPERTKETWDVIQKSSVETFKAITQYKVLASHGRAALVECTPSTGVKHQIRVHLAFGLNTPVLGDHKYSHITKVAPQRLHPDLLDHLGIRQSKVRHLPMMLHAKSLLIPEFQDGRNIFISSRLPLHFKINMHRLKIKPPKMKK